MNSNGLFCSTLILCTLTFQGCTQLNTQVSKVKSVLPGGKEKDENALAAARSMERQKEWIGAREIGTASSRPALLVNYTRALP